MTFSQKKTFLKYVIGAFLVLLILLICLYVCIWKSKGNIFSLNQTSVCKDCNVLLISLDTCGADHMSTYGYERDTTPNLTELAKKGILFQNAHVNANWTLPSHVSIFTGLFPLHHKVREAGVDVLDASIPLLPEVLQQHGYETVFYAPDNQENIPEKQVYSRGITRWNKLPIKWHVSDVKSFQMALDELKKNIEENKKTFMFYHTYACHGPYIPEDEPLLYANVPDAFLPFRSEDVDGAPFSESFWKYVLVGLEKDMKEGNVKIAPIEVKNLYQQLRNAANFDEAKRIYDAAADQEMFGERDLFGKYVWEFGYENKIDENNPKHVEYLRALYDQGVHSMDEHILGLLRKTIDNGALPKNTVIVITADHGEEFMEHGELLHMTIYDNNTRVPLVVLAPDIQPNVITEHVQSTDIFPTILDVVGIPNRYTFDGLSLSPLIYNQTLGDRLILAETNWNTHPLSLSVRNGDWKLFLFREADDPLRPYALYNTKTDPSEKNNIISQQMKRVKEMVKQFNALNFPFYRAIEE